jgi:hypothetical protein
MERKLDEAANRTAYFLAVHSGKLRFVLKTEHLKTSADTALHCSTQHLNGHSVLQLFDGTPHRALLVRATYALIFIGGDLGCVGAIPIGIAKAAAVPRPRRPSLCA